MTAIVPYTVMQSSIFYKLILKQCAFMQTQWGLHGIYYRHTIHGFNPWIESAVHPSMYLPYARAFQGPR